MVDQVNVVVHFVRTMHGHNRMVRYAAVLVERFVGQVVTPGEVVAVCDKHWTIFGHDEEAGSGGKRGFSEVHPYEAGHS